MKTITNKKIKLFLGLMLSLFIVFGGLFAGAIPASALTCDSATLTGTVNTGTTPPPVWAQFKYSTSYSTVANNGGIATSMQYFYTQGSFPIEQYISGLSENTTYYYRLIVYNNYGTYPANIMNFTTPPCQQANPTVNISASPSTITSGQSSTLSWNSQNATSCSIPQFGNVSVNGNRTVSPTSTTIYNITCNGASGTTPASDSATVSVNQVNPTGNLTVSPSNCTISANQSTCSVTGATWTTNNATSPALIDRNTGATLSTAANRPIPLTVWIAYPNTTFDLKNNGTTLDTAVATATCASQTSWDGARCAQVINTYTVTGNAGTGGNISPTSQQVTSGNTTTLSVNPNSGYTINSVTGCNGYLNGNTYYTGAITSSCTVYASFNQTQPQTYTVTGNAGTGGNISPTSQQVTSGNTTTLSVNPNSGYTVGNVTGCNGSLSGNTYYTGAITSSCTVYAYFSAVQGQNPYVDLTASPSNIDSGERSTLSWESTNADYCDASWTWGDEDADGYDYVYPTSTRTYTITCYGNNGASASDSVTVNVSQDNDEVSVDLTASDTNIDEGDRVTLSWESENADYCDASWTSGNEDTDGDDYVYPTSTRTYSITCYGDGDSDSDSVTIYVNEDNDDNNEEPDVITRNATNVGISGATLNGWVDGNGLSVRAWFEYGTNTNLGYSTSRNSYGSGSTNFDRNISGLSPNTIYYFRAVAENSEDTVYGSILSFRTLTDFVNTQPTVNLYADNTSLSYNTATFLRWNTANATSCFASGGSAGWAGTKSIGPGSFYTGSLTSSRTYTITCSNSFGSATDSVTVIVHGQVLGVTAPTSLVLITSSIDRNQPIVPTLDNTNPCPGDEINYTITYQNIGTGAITGLNLRIDLPYETDYMFSNPNNPTRSGNTLIFNLGTLKANGQGTVTVRVRVRDNAPAGINLNFPAVLSYVDPSGFPQSVTANVSANVCKPPVILDADASLEANAFGAGFLPTNLFGWLLLLILILLLVLLAKYLFGKDRLFNKKTTTTTDQPSGKKTTTTTIQ